MSNLNYELETPFLSLPSEIWEMILEYVDQNDRIKHRLVCKKWKDLIDTHSTFRISLREEMNHLERIGNLRIRSLELIGLKTPKNLTLRHPGLLRQLTVGSYTYWKALSPLLGKNIEELAIFATLKSDKSLAIDDSSTDEDINESLKGSLSNLKHINLGFHFFGDRGPKDESTSFQRLIGNPIVTFPAVSSLTVSFTLSETEWILFLAFLKRHNGTLRRLNLNSPCFGTTTQVLEDPCLTLKSLTVASLGGSCKGCKREELWNILLTSSTALEEVDVEYEGLHFDTVTTLVQQNSRTLVNLSLRALALDPMRWEDRESIEGDLFAQATRLSSLNLSARPSAFALIRPTLIIHAVNPPIRGEEWCESGFRRISSLPSSLTHFSLANLPLVEEEIAELPGTCPRLRTVCFKNALPKTTEVIVRLLAGLGEVRRLEVSSESIPEGPRWEEVKAATAPAYDPCTLNWVFSFEQSGDGRRAGESLLPL